MKRKILKIIITVILTVTFIAETSFSANRHVPNSSTVTENRCLSTFSDSALRPASIDNSEREITELMEVFEIQWPVTFNNLVDDGQGHYTGLIHYYLYHEQFLEGSLLDLLTHIECSRSIISMLADRLRLGNEDKRLLLATISLHDTGKLRNGELWRLILSDITIPYDPTDKNRQLLNSHAAHSESIAKTLQEQGRLNIPPALQQDLYALIRWHHDPSQITNARLRRLCEMIFWVDNTEAMMAKRPYQKKEWTITSIEQAKGVLETRAAKFFSSGLCAYRDIHNALLEVMDNPKLTQLYNLELRKNAALEQEKIDITSAIEQAALRPPAAKFAYADVSDFLNRYPADSSWLHMQNKPGAYRTLREIVDDELPSAIFALTKIVEIRNWMDANGAYQRPLVIWQNMRLGEMFPYFSENIKKRLGIVEVNYPEYRAATHSRDDIPARIKQARYILIKKKASSTQAEDFSPGDDWKPHAIYEPWVADEIKANALKLKAPVVMIDHSTGQFARAQEYIMDCYRLQREPFVEINTGNNAKPEHLTDILKTDTFFIFINARRGKNTMPSYFDNSYTLLEHSAEEKVIVAGREYFVRDLFRQAYGDEIERIYFGGNLTQGSQFDLSGALDTLNIHKAWEVLNLWDFPKDEHGRHRKFTDAEIKQKLAQKTAEITAARRLQDVQRAALESCLSKLLDIIENKETKGNSPVISTESRTSGWQISYNDLELMGRALPYFNHYIPEGSGRRIYLLRGAGSHYESAYYDSLIKGVPFNAGVFTISTDTIGRHMFSRIHSLLEDAAATAMDYQGYVAESMRLFKKEYESSSEFRETVDTVYEQMGLAGILNGANEFVFLDEVDIGTYQLFSKFIVEEKTRGAKKVNIFVGNASTYMPPLVEGTCLLEEFPQLDKASLMRDFEATQQEAREIIIGVSDQASEMPHPVFVNSEGAKKQRQTFAAEQAEIVLFSYLRSLLIYNGLIDFYARRSALREKLDSGDSAGYIFRGPLDNIIPLLMAQSETFTPLRNSIDRAGIAEKMRNLLKAKKERLGSINYKPAGTLDIIPIEVIIKMAIDDFEQFDLIEHGAILTNKDENNWAWTWLLGFNTHDLPTSPALSEEEQKLKKFLRVLFNEPPAGYKGHKTIGYAREILDYAEAAHEHMLLEYLLHEALCPYIGHLKTREVLERMFENTNYKGAEAQGWPLFAKRRYGNLDGPLTKIIRKIRHGNFYVAEPISPETAGVSLPDENMPGQAAAEDPAHVLDRIENLIFSSSPGSRNTEEIQQAIDELTNLKIEGKQQFEKANRLMGALLIMAYNRKLSKNTASNIFALLDVEHTLQDIRKAIIDPRQDDETNVIRQGAVLTFIGILTNNINAAAVPTIAEYAYEFLSNDSVQVMVMADRERAEDEIVRGLMRMLRNFYRDENCRTFCSEAILFLADFANTRKQSAISDEITWEMAFMFEKIKKQRTAEAHYIKSALKDAIINIATEQLMPSFVPTDAVDFALTLLRDDGENLAGTILDDIAAVRGKPDTRAGRHIQKSRSLSLEIGRSALRPMSGRYYNFTLTDDVISRIGLIIECAESAGKNYLDGNEVSEILKLCRINVPEDISIKTLLDAQFGHFIQIQGHNLFVPDNEDLLIRAYKAERLLTEAGLDYLDVDSKLELIDTIHRIAELINHVYAGRFAITELNISDSGTSLKFDVIDFGIDKRQALPKPADFYSSAAQGLIKVEKDLSMLFDPQFAAVIGIPSAPINGLIGQLGFMSPAFKKRSNDADGEDRVVLLDKKTLLSQDAQVQMKNAEIARRLDFVIVAERTAEEAVSRMRELLKIRAEAKTVPEDKKILFFVITAGFIDAGEKGIQAQKALEELLKDYPDAYIIGPNCLGLTNTDDKRGAYGLFLIMPVEREMGRLMQKGASALFSQSGTFLARWTEEDANQDWTTAISYGNASNVSHADFLNAILKHKPWIKDVTFYIEGFKPGEGMAFCDAIKKARRMGVNVNIYYGPTVINGDRLNAYTHTGAIVAEPDLLNAALTQAGANIMPRKITLAFDETKVGKTFDGRYAGWAKKQVQRNIPATVAMVTGAGEEATIFNEVFAESPCYLELASIDTFSEETKDKLRDTIGALPARVIEPLDLSAAASIKRYLDAIEAHLKEDKVDCLVISTVPRVPPIGEIMGATEVKPDGFYPRLAELLAKYPDKPVIVAIPVGHRDDLCPYVTRFLDENNVPWVMYAPQAGKFINDLIAEQLRQQETDTQKFVRTMMAIMYSNHEVANKFARLNYAFSEARKHPGQDQQPLESLAAYDKDAQVIMEQFKALMKDVANAFRCHDKSADNTALQKQWEAELVSIRQSMLQMAEKSISSLAGLPFEINEDITMQCMEMYKIFNIFTSYIETGILTLNIEEIDVATHLRIRTRLDKTDTVDIAHEFDPSLSTICTDKDLLSLLIRNIQQNANDAMLIQAPEETEGNRVFTIRTRRENNFAAVSFSDTGLGISEEDLPRIFEPSFTKGKPKGTGLGLALVKEIVKQLGGEIEVESLTRQEHEQIKIIGYGHEYDLEKALYGDLALLAETKKAYDSINKASEILQHGMDMIIDQGLTDYRLSMLLTLYEETLTYTESLCLTLLQGEKGKEYAQLASFISDSFRKSMAFSRGIFEMSQKQPQPNIFLRQYEDRIKNEIIRHKKLMEIFRRLSEGKRISPGTTFVVKLPVSQQQILATSTENPALAAQESLAKMLEQSALRPLASAKAARAVAPAIREKWVYFFGAGKAEGRAYMSELLGNKGARLAESTRLGFPVPPGFTITTKACHRYLKSGKNKFPKGLQPQINKNLKQLETLCGKKLGDPKNPLLVSVRSGARVSMPGMMDTIVNLGLSDASVLGLARQTKNEYFAYSCYLRLIEQFGSVVFGISRTEFKQIKRKRQDTNIDKAKKRFFDAGDLKYLVAEFKKLFRRRTGRDFPQDPKEQLCFAIEGVFKSSGSERAVFYRSKYGIPEDAVSAATVQAMVFGNKNNNCATGVIFSRNNQTGEKEISGEFLINAQGEDVVSGLVTPSPIAELKEVMPGAYHRLAEIARRLEEEVYHDLVDVEFTIEDGEAWQLQDRVAKPSPSAALKIALDMVEEGIITAAEALKRVDPQAIRQALSYAIVDPKAVESARILAKGFAISSRGASGKAVFDSRRAYEMSRRGEKVILVAEKTDPSDLRGMLTSQGFLTSAGGRSCHAALVARGENIPAIVGAKGLRIGKNKREFSAAGLRVKEGDWITIDGIRGCVYLGELPLIQVSEVDIEESPLYTYYRKLCKWAEDAKSSAEGAKPVTIDDISDNTIAQAALRPMAESLATYQQAALCDFDNILISKTASIITKDCLTDQEKILSISSWVADNISYGIGYGAYWDAPASETLIRRHGMCFNMANLLIAMARSVGIEAEYGVALRKKETFEGLVPQERYEKMGPVSEHIFARVFIEGEWKIIDIGYMEKATPVFLTEQEFLSRLPFTIEGSTAYSKSLDELALEKAKKDTHPQRDAYEDELVAGLEQKSDYSRSNFNLVRSDDELTKITSSMEFIASLSEEVKLDIVMPMWEETARLNPKSASYKSGEDALRKKIKQFMILSELNPRFKWRLIAVDDGSNEASSAECVRTLWQQICAEYAQEGKILRDDQLEIIVIAKEQKEGKKGGAILAGLRRSVADKWADHTLITDVDTSINASETGNLLKDILEGRADVAIGSRRCEGATEKEPFLRGISSAAFSRAVGIMLPPIADIRDTQRGFKLFRREVLEDILGSAEDCTLTFDTELLLLTKLAGYHIKEVAIAWFDSAEESRVSRLKDPAKMLLNIARQRKRILNPAFIKMFKATVEAKRARRQSPQVILRLSTREIEAAIKDFFEKDAQRNASFAVKHLFGEGTTAQDIQDIKWQKVHEGIFLHIFKAEIQLHNGKSGYVCVNVPTEYGEYSDLAKRDFDNLTRFYGAYPEKTAKPIVIDRAETGARQINVFATEWLSGYSELNDFYKDTPHLNIGSEYHADRLTATVKSLVEMADYNLRWDQVNFINWVKLNAGDFLLRQDPGSDEISVKLITIRGIAQDKSPCEFLDYLLGNKFCLLYHARHPEAALHTEAVLKGISQGLIAKFGQDQGAKVFKRWMSLYRNSLIERYSVLNNSLRLDRINGWYKTWLEMATSDEDFKDARFHAQERAVIKKCLEDKKMTRQVRLILEEQRELTKTVRQGIDNFMVIYTREITSDAALKQILTGISSAA